jgi:phosphatidylglycerol:prolipoprotein diacylglycerol transferase
VPEVLIAFLRYDPLVRIHIGPLSISPHGMGIAVGFLLGAWVFLGWCRKAGLTDDQVYSLVNRAAIGSIIGARVAYVINHPGDFSNPLEIFAVWKGGISLLGGIGGAVLAGVPKMRSEGLSFWKVMDLAVPCVTMGIIVGRIGDLVIADHLGKPTDFFLGYVCPSHVTGSPCLAPIGQAVHQPALYDFFSAILLLAVLMRLRRTVRYDGFLTLFFGAWYGTGRLMEDFFRIDETHGTGLTGSQWTAVTVLGLCLFSLIVLKDTPWRSGKGAFESVPRRHRSEEAAVVAEEESAPAEVDEPPPVAPEPETSAEESETAG